MKKTLSVNLAGIPFQIDEDAYQLLERYLTDLKVHFRKEEGADEIVEDIEVRIAELLQEKLSVNAVIVTQLDVEQVIAQIGSPEEMSEGTETCETEDTRTCETEETGAEPAARNDRPKRVKRRLFRNSDDKVLGGVLGGLAVYLRMDVSALRLFVLVVFVVNAIFSFPILMFLSYLICWGVIPQARTAADKLAMQGESVTVENIGKTVIEDFEEKDGRTVEGAHSADGQQPKGFLSRMMGVIGLLLKVSVIVLAVVLSPLLLVVFGVLSMLVVSGMIMLLTGGAVFWDLLPSGLSDIVAETGVLGSIGMLLMIGIPIGTLVYLVLQSLFHWRPVPHPLKWVLLGLWLVSFVTMLVYGGWSSWRLMNQAFDDFLPYSSF